MTHSARLRHPSACRPAPAGSKGSDSPADLRKGMRLRWTRLQQRLRRRANPYSRHPPCNLVIYNAQDFCLTNRIVRFIEPLRADLSQQLAGAKQVQLKRWEHEMDGNRLRSREFPLRNITEG
jgi:hypothetical protein